MARLPRARNSTSLSLVVALFAAGCAGGPSDPNPGGPPSCSGGGFGGLGCVCVASSCTCAGTDACNSVCGDGCAVACNNVGGCTAACGIGCTATCNGTNSCAFHVGPSSQIVCNGTGGCDTICEGGDCSATCNATSGCTLRCPADATCELVCTGTLTDCGGGVQVCARACPTA